MSNSTSWNRGEVLHLDRSLRHRLETWFDWDQSAWSAKHLYSSHDLACWDLTCQLFNTHNHNAPGRFATQTAYGKVAMAGWFKHEYSGSLFSCLLLFLAWLLLGWILKPIDRMFSGFYPVVWKVVRSVVKNCHETRMLLQSRENSCSKSLKEGANPGSRMIWT